MVKNLQREAFRVALERLAWKVDLPGRSPNIREVVATVRRRSPWAEPEKGDRDG